METLDLVSSLIAVSSAIVCFRRCTHLPWKRWTWCPHSLLTTTTPAGALSCPACRPTPAAPTSCPACRPTPAVAWWVRVRAHCVSSVCSMLGMNRCSYRPALWSRCWSTPPLLAMMSGMSCWLSDKVKFGLFSSVIRQINNSSNDYNTTGCIKCQINNSSNNYNTTGCIKCQINNSSNDYNSTRHV